MKKYQLGFWIVLAVLVNSALWIGLNSQIQGLYAENGVMENIQAVSLLATALLFAWKAGGSASSAGKTFFASLALFATSILILEVDFRHLDAPLLNKLMNGRVRDAWLGSLWLVLAVFAFRNFAAVWKEFMAWLRSGAGLLMIVGGIFWVLSALIDKALLGKKELFREELMEMNAVLFMAWSALRSKATKSN